MGAADPALVYRAYDALNRRDLDALLDTLEPDVEFSSHLTELEANSAIFRGHDGFREYVAMVDDMWDEARWEVTEVAELDPDRILASVRFEGRGRASDVRVSQELGLILTTAPSGKAARIVAYGTPADARSAAAAATG